MITRVRADMPVAEPRLSRERGWWIAPAGYAVIAVAMFAWAWSIASHPNGYAGCNKTQAQWVFPMDTMMDFLKAFLVEVGIVTFILSLRVRVSVGGRAMLLAGLMFVFMVLAAMPLLMHASAPTPQFLLFQPVGAIWLIAFALVTKSLARQRSVR